MFLLLLGLTMRVLMRNKAVRRELEQVERPPRIDQKIRRGVMTEPTPPAEMQERPAERPPLWRLFLYAAPFAVFALWALCWRSKFCSAAPPKPRAAR